MRAILWVAAFASLTAMPVHGQMNGMSGIADSQPMDRDSTDVDKAIRAVEAEGVASDPPAKQSVAYQENLRVRREEAVQYAAAVRNGAQLPTDAAASLRHELEADIEQWRAEFKVGHKEAQTMRDRWLVATDSLTGGQWAQQRVDWWKARDAWVVEHRR